MQLPGISALYKSFPTNWMMFLVFCTFFPVQTAAQQPVTQSGETKCIVLDTLANIGLEDDGIRFNKKGGWTDEGINDMHLYPPLNFSDTLFAGIPFELIDTAQTDGMAAVALRGSVVLGNKPESLAIAINGAKYRYAYFLHHSTGIAEGRPVRDSVYSCTFVYEDGTHKRTVFQDKKHIAQWWVDRWTYQDAAGETPMYLAYTGVNVYSQKWQQLIGLWATRIENPLPEKKIKALRLHSFSQAAPVIWAITLSNQQFEAQSVSIQNPPVAPKGYFARKKAQEKQHLTELMVDKGLIQGIISARIIRDDIIAVTIDQAASGEPTGQGEALMYQSPHFFSVSSPTDSAFLAPLIADSIGRWSYERYNADIGPYPNVVSYWHEYYLYLPHKLSPRHEYRIESEPFFVPSAQTRHAFYYDDASTEVKVIKVNQAAYAAASTSRYAYLGWWAGDAKAVDYRRYQTAYVLSAHGGDTVAVLPITLRREADSLSGEKVYQIDLSELDTGLYFLHIPNLGVSSKFAVGGNRQAAVHYHTMRAFLHQRCGQKLAQPWSKVQKEACHLQCYKSGYLVEDLDEQGKNQPTAYTPQPGEPTRSFRGGYHDAADFDHFTYHLSATAQMLHSWMHYRQRGVESLDFTLPDTTTELPDVLKEARWALSFYMDTQQDDGAIFMGRGNDADAFAQRTNGVRTPWGLLPPETQSGFEFAATAALYSKALNPFSKRDAARYQKAAEKAFAWALARTDAAQPDPVHTGPVDALDRREDVARYPQLQVWAAGELYSLTGKKKYAEIVSGQIRKIAISRESLRHDQFLPIFLYATARYGNEQDQSPGIAQKIILQSADSLLQRIEKSSYRLAWNPGEGKLGWGNGNGGGYYADVLLRAYWLTEKQHYLDAASLQADFQLGCNPLSMSLITGVGSRPPRRPQISFFLYRDFSELYAHTVAGISIYGFSTMENPQYYPHQGVPPLRSRRDIWGNRAESSSEFTIHECIGPAVLLYHSLWAQSAVE